jgi:hypothetical protein
MEGTRAVQISVLHQLAHRYIRIEQLAQALRVMDLGSGDRVTGWAPARASAGSLAAVSRLAITAGCDAIRCFAAERLVAKPQWLGSWAANSIGW